MKICLQCGYPILKNRAEFIALRSNGTEMWLCGRKQCDTDYSDSKPPKVRRVAKKAR